MSNTCRFCNKSAHSSRLVKYGERHYAHHQCYLDAGKRLEDLHDWQIVEFPFQLLKDRGLYAVAEQAMDRIDADLKARGIR